MTSKEFVVVIPAAFGGGLLRDFNRLLRAQAALLEAAEEGQAQPPAVLWIDDRLSQAADRDLYLLNARGDAVRHPGPAQGRFREGERKAFLEAVIDTLPPTRHGRNWAERLFPRSEESPEEAAQRLWKSVVEPAGWQVRTGPAPSPETETEDRPDILWLGPRHLQAMQEMNLPLKQVLAGEKVLKSFLRKRQSQSSRIATLGQALQQQWETGLTQLEAAIRQDDPAFMGAWMRLRRDGRKAHKEFMRRVDRNLRNRSGIQGARSHALCQAVLPQGHRQQDFLSLFTAATLFGLDLDRFVAYAETLKNLPSGDPQVLCTNLSSEQYKLEDS
ncbi:MAG: hypothetical protein DWQ01_05840 [Planctomycetota bacterium]|nr:MAG: hypothetical protein DWQ01_05840 [Planctomycetota bacterium]